MDRSAAPWRVLDEEAAPPSEAEANQQRPADRWLTARLVVGLGLAGILAVVAFALAVTGPVGSVQVGGAAAWPSDAPDASSEQVAPGGKVVVDVQGAVLQPGVQQLAAGARVADAIAAAGGYGPRVDASRVASELNLAAAIHDGDRIVVPARGDPAGAADAGKASAGPGGGLVDLNTATAGELDELPGVGPKTAQKILDARAQKPFASVGELRDRKIVGAATYEKLQSLVTVR